MISFENLFIESKGQPIIYNGKELKMIDKIELSSNRITLKIQFISTDSKWKQGIVFQTKGEFEVNNEHISTKIILWEDTSPKDLILQVKSRDKRLVVYNVWQTEDGTTHYWHNGGAMYVKEIDSIRTYNCNDGYADDDLNDLIFTIEYM